MTKKSKYGGAPVQTYAFGGIANPSQRAFLRGSDQAYLDARQKELDAFEQQRLAYNDQLTKWQTEVYNPYKAQVDAYNAASAQYNTDIYNPYKAQVDAYNAAAEKYNTEVYNPYKTQFDAYKEAVDAWNAGDRTTDYAGPAEPKLTSEFTMAAPTQPKAFEMAAPTTPEQFSGVAPVLPFKEEEVKARQQEAAGRARQDAGNRAVAIDVASNPDQFNFGSMSVSHRFMAKGGEVKEKSAKEMLGEMNGGYEPSDAEVLKMVHDISSKGKLTHAQIMDAVERVAAQGRGGDELLAYLSPQSVELLKKMGGAGSINPATGLHEFKGGFIGKIVNAVRNVFSPRSAAASAPAAAAAAPVANMAAEDTGPKPPSAAELMKQLEASNSAKAALQTKYDTDMASFKTQAQKDQEAAIAAALKADAEKRAGMIAAPVIGDKIDLAQNRTPFSNPFDNTAKGMLAQMPSGDPMSPNFVGPRTPEEEARYKALDKSTASYNAPGGPGFALMSPADKMAAIDKSNASYNEPGGPGYALTQNPAAPLAKDKVATPGLVGGTIGSRSVTGGPVSNIPIQSPNISFDMLKAANPLGKVDLGGRISSPITGGSGGAGGGSRPTPRGPDVSGTFEGSLPYVGDRTMPAVPSYSDRGVGAIGGIGGGNIPIFGPTGPSFDYSPIGNRGGAATSPSSYFAMTPQTSTGLAPGSAAIGPADMPLYGAKNTMGAIGANSNLSPTMLGGMQNAGVMTDRLGNRIYSPGMGPLFGFAKGGGVDLSALTEMNASNLSDEQPEETINTNPVGSAQQMLSDINSLGQTQYDISPTRQSIKRTRVTPVSGEGGAKGMKMEYESLTKGDLSSMKDLKPEAKNTDSARAQMEELARTYKLKIRAAENKARGLMADTLGAPTLEQPTLTKGSLTKKRFQKGGEAKKARGGETERFASEGLPAPGLMNATIWADTVSREMYPSDKENVKRDAARHMMAAAILANKTGPGIAETLGKLHEFKESPFRTGGHWLGLTEPRPDYPTDVHNNAVGASMAGSAADARSLERAVREAVNRGSTTAREPGRAALIPDDAKSMAYRADGSPEEGEIGPAFVTPKSGKGRKEGEISRQLKSGEAYTNMAKGVTELPYDIAGAPVDLATMLMRPFGYGTEKPVMSSDWIKEKMTGAGVRPEPPADPTAKGFYTAGELLSNLTNPAGATRTAVKGAQKAGQAATDVAKDFQQYNRQLTVPGASYAVRPTGSTMLSGPVGLNKNVSEVDQLLNNGISNARSVAGQNAGQEELIKEFWDKKARNYFMRQFGTPDDPIAAAISKKQIKGTALEEMFPEYMLDQIAAGKTRVNEQGQERFFPKYPRAMEDFTKRYDQATGLKGNLVTTDPAAADPGYNLISSKGREMARSAADTEADKMISQGLRPELINTEVGAVTRSVKDPERILSDGTNASKDMLAAFEEASAYKKMTPEQQAAWANEQFGNGRPLHGLDYDEVGKNLLAENVRTAIEKGQPVYDIGYMGKPLKTLFKPDNINTYLASLPPRELANIRFEDAVRGGLKMNERAISLRTWPSASSPASPWLTRCFQLA